MSTKTPEAAKRPYRKRRRAELEQQTRRRITEAAVELHGSVGPARTTMSAVADRAGVQRATLYRHFPDEETLFHACSSHWAAQHPPPDFSRWAAIEDPGERLRSGLGELYDWYASNERMLENVGRDAALVPAMQAPAAAFAAGLQAAADALVDGRPERGARRKRLRAAAGHATAFETWRSLVREQGLSEAQSVELMARLVATAASPGTQEVAR
jgi:AcrR family transcriptional regulator